MLAPFLAQAAQEPSFMGVTPTAISQWGSAFQSLGVIAVLAVVLCVAVWQGLKRLDVVSASKEACVVDRITDMKATQVMTVEVIGRNTQALDNIAKVVSDHTDVLRDHSEVVKELARVKGRS